MQLKIQLVILLGGKNVIKEIACLTMVTDYVLFHSEMAEMVISTKMNR